MESNKESEKSLDASQNDKSSSKTHVRPSQPRQQQKVRSSADDEVADTTSSSDSSDVLRGRGKKSPQPNKKQEVRSSSGTVTKTISLLGPYDVLTGRGKKAWNNPGNEYFRVIINNNVQLYQKASTFKAKSTLIVNVIKQMQTGLGARFVKEGTNGQYEILNRKETHNKVGHAFRDALNRWKSYLSSPTPKPGKPQIWVSGTPKVLPDLDDT